MPGQIKTIQPTDTPKQKPSATTETVHDYDTVNKNTQHSHALRLALGSILTPKRPYSPSSHSQSKSSSGTSSPALSYSFSSPPSSSVATPSSNPPSPPQPPQVPHSTPVPMYRLPDHYLQSLQQFHANAPLHHIHQLSQVHTPSRLGQLEHPPQAGYVPAKPDSTGPATMTQTHSYAPQTAVPAQHPHPQSPAPEHAEHAVHAPTSTGDDPAVAADGSTPTRPRYIKTLQSKSAWDALIHGSFS